MENKKEAEPHPYFEVEKEDLEEKFVFKEPPQVTNTCMEAGMSETVYELEKTCPQSTPVESAPAEVNDPLHKEAQPQPSSTTCPQAPPSESGGNSAAPQQEETGDLDPIYELENIDEVIDSLPEEAQGSVSGPNAEEAKRGSAAGTAPLTKFPVSVRRLSPFREMEKMPEKDLGLHDSGSYDTLNLPRVHDKPSGSRQTMGRMQAVKDKEKTRRRQKSRTLGRPGKKTMSRSMPNLTQGAAVEGEEESEDKIYESVYQGDESGDGWSSSEFEEYTDYEDDFDEVPPMDEAPNKPLPPKPKQQPITDKVGLENGAGTAEEDPKFWEAADMDVEETLRCLPVDINPSKHPPPELPPLPESLTDNQKKRRCMVELIVQSEKSYVNSLIRIIEEFEKPVLDAIGGLKPHIRVVFKEAHEILSHHRMFHIELADRVKRWDKEEKIGDIFTASFSKGMLVDAYSSYVNNFAAAMEEIKAAQCSRQSFQDFLREKERSGPDRMSIFGLMVKPVQRFPQFIMLLQDLVKHTPQNHPDRGSLQLALTELENVTHKLNERKRHSEQEFLARQLIAQLSSSHQIANHFLLKPPGNTPRRLLRQNDFEQVDEVSGQMKTKMRRLVLMHDALLCMKVTVRSENGFDTERYRLRWMAHLRDVELKDSAITANMESSISGSAGKLRINSPQTGKSEEEDPYHLHADLSDMLHDLTVLGEISNLVSTLKCTYAGLSAESLLALKRDVQQLIEIKDEQFRLVDSCSIIFYHSARGERTRYVFQTATPAMKQDWCADFLMAKLALEGGNNPGWDVSASSEAEAEFQPAFFMKSLQVDVPRNFASVKCAIPVYLCSGQRGGLGVQNLWVCSTTPARSFIAVISVHNTKPSLTESFRVCQCDVNCIELVPGFGDGNGPFVFPEDTVWIATVDSNILVFSLYNENGTNRSPLVKFKATAEVKVLKYYDERIFCGLVDGRLSVMDRNDDGEWGVSTPQLLKLGEVEITCALMVEDDLWVACGNKLFILAIDTLKIKTCQKLASQEDYIIQHIVRAGVGAWISFRHRSHLRLYHIETLQNLQEINVASAISRFLGSSSHVRKSSLPAEEGSEANKDCAVSSLAASRGLLWVGTTTGFILTLMLPRLRDGVPLASGRPSVSRHAHHGPVEFIVPLVGASRVAELDRLSSLASHLQGKERTRRPAQRQSPGKDTAASDGRAAGAEAAAGPTPSRNGSEGSSPSLSNSRKTTPKRELSFRTELASKIAERSSSREGVDVEEEDEDEVNRLYENLLEPNPEVVASLLPREAGHSGKYSHGPRTLFSRRPLPPPPPSTFEESPYEAPPRSGMADPRGSVMKNFTLRKSVNNAIVVVSGGNGYCDWARAESRRSSTQTEDASLLLWVYKS